MGIYGTWTWHFLAHWYLPMLKLHTTDICWTWHQTTAHWKMQTLHWRRVPKFRISDFLTERKLRWHDSCDLDLNHSEWAELWHYFEIVKLLYKWSADNRLMSSLYVPSCEVHLKLVLSDVNSAIEIIISWILNEKNNLITQAHFTSFQTSVLETVIDPLPTQFP